jgi:hypothetical protein
VFVGEEDETANAEHEYDRVTTNLTDRQVLTAEAQFSRSGPSWKRAQFISGATNENQFL